MEENIRLNTVVTHTAFYYNLSFKLVQGDYEYDSEYHSVVTIIYHANLSRRFSRKR